MMARVDRTARVPEYCGGAHFMPLSIPPSAE